MLGGAIPRIKEALAHRGEDSLELCWACSGSAQPFLGAWTVGACGAFLPGTPWFGGLVLLTSLISASHQGSGNGWRLPLWDLEGLRSGPASHSSHSCSPHTSCSHRLCLASGTSGSFLPGGCSLCLERFLPSLG